MPNAPSMIDAALAIIGIVLVLLLQKSLSNAS